LRRTKDKHMKLPKKVTVVEVGPRDGFQSEKHFIPTNEKIAIVNALSLAGLRNIQVTSVVHPKAIPQLADAEEVMTGIDRLPGVSYRILAPNLRGVQRAVLLKPDAINLMMSVTDSHNRSNANRSVEESMKEFETFVPMIRDAGISVVGGMACALGCPFEGKIPIQQLERIVNRYLSMDIRSIGLSDTVGVANPQLVYDVVSHLLDKYPDVHFHMHFHNNRGLALANILAGMQAGVTEFDSTIGGLGGCPYAPNASGNISTEDVVNMMTEIGIETGVDLDALLLVSEMVKKVIPHSLDSAVVKSGKPWVLLKAPNCQVKVG
jgi:hydroxymethylglutaryl-CoA lyase